MSRNLSLYLNDILKSIRNIRDYTDALSYEELIDDQRTLDAVTHNLLIIGEATKQIPNTLRNRYPQISWPEIAGLRDIIAHTYFRLNTRIIWNIIQDDLSPLEDCIVTMQQDEKL